MPPPTVSSFTPLYPRYLNGQTALQLPDEENTTGSTDRRLTSHITGTFPFPSYQDYIWTKLATRDAWANPDEPVINQRRVRPDIDAYFGAASEVTNSSQAWGTNQQRATTLQWMGHEVYDYFRERHNIFGFNNNTWGPRMLSFVQPRATAPIIPNYQGARYVQGSSTTQGREILLLGYNLHQLDVVGHEFSHGVTDHSSKLVYEYESGALDEGFADIFGTCVEKRTLPNTWNWRIAEDMDGIGFRDLADPNLLGNPATYGGTFWFDHRNCISPNFDFCGVHIHSGVLGRWFSLLCTGSMNTTPQVTPLNFAIVERIAYQTLINLQSTSDFNDARERSITETRRIYGSCSFEERMVANAWALLGHPTFDNGLHNWAPSPCEPSCQFSFSSTPNQNVACGSTTTLTSTCTGDCEGIQYQWVNQQLQNIGTTPSIQATVPNASGTYFYHLIAYKTRINLPGCYPPPATTTLTTPSTCTPPPNCNFAVTASHSPTNPQINQSVTLSSVCAGSDCGAVAYNWSGNGISGSAATKTINAPATAGSYAYTITLSKTGCADKTDITTVNVQDTPPASFDQCLEAENASGPGSVMPDAGASGQNYKWSYNSANDYNTYTVMGVTNSNINYYLKLRYATGEAPSAGVLVNGVLQPNLFPLINTASWSGTYGELEYPYPITLNTGNNTITIRGSSTGTFTQDRICVSSTSTSNSCFNVTASTSNGNPSGGGAITLTANCTGTCSGVSYAWNGPNGYNATGSPVTTNAPTAAAIYNYTLTASKSGCATKQSTVQVTVGIPPTYTQCMEAENATGVGSSNADPAASNGLNMGNYGNSSEYRTYTFDNVPLADNYPFTLRYVSGEAPTAGIIVNGGAVNNLSLPTTSSWSGNYAQRTLTVYLQAGTNTIRVQGAGNGTFRQDKACVGCTAGNCRIGVAEEELVKAPESTELTAYPNPTTGEVTVSFPLGIGQEARISVFAMSGIIVQEHLVAGKNETHTQVLDLSHETTGTYLVRVMKDNEVLTRKVLLKK